ncbi:selenide, water dikinase SelD [Pseudomonas sp. So3.2b]|uniref:selenide, water dikinase SelD n=1 Tax=Pseudomonas TaxID=286 RepID=UPI0016453E17|nr:MULTISPECIES: selenide, water dikinase SelD [Pseudomonas]QXH90132.1 selenide, water dikinase SelD [Pseudomonas shahriarae]QYM69643.1 selenide, water dikinase SelD [Pseudomonas sp. So3.2b]
MSMFCQIMDKSESGGCGCKIPSSVLTKILSQTAAANTVSDDKVVLGFESSDDCAVYDAGEKYLLFTTDFFSPIVNDPYIFGQLAASNAVSDIFASGGSPLIANSIMAFDPEQVSVEQVTQMILGAQSVMNRFNVSIVGGHTIKNSQPLYGFSIIGEVEKHRLKKNNTARAGDLLVMTRPIGVGILANALKSGVIEQKDIAASTLAQITGNNAFGRTLSESPEVSSLTDITGFGLIGHISEMVGLGQLDVDLDTSSLVFYDGTESLAVAVTSADSGIFSNIKKYAQNVEYLTDPPLARKFLLHDPQTNGGLLFTVSAEGFEKNHQKWQALCPDLIVIGRMTEGTGKIKVC